MLETSSLRRFTGVRFALAGALALAALLTSCAVGPNYHTPHMSVPDRYAATASDTGSVPAATAAPAVDLARWWRALEDTELDSLIERAVRSNPDALIALDRLQAARTYELGIAGSLLPAAAASGAYGRGTGDDNARGRAAEPLVTADNPHGLNSINEVGGFAAVWEVDVFGKVRRQMEAAHDNAQAAADARNAVLVSVVADVAQAYVDLRGLQMRASVLHSSIDVLRQSLDLVTQRYERGITNELDVTLARRELASLQAQVAPVDAQVLAAQYTIATLLGAYPEDLVRELSAAGMVPSVPAVVDTGLPVDLLRRRPDIMQAERDLASSNAQIGVATADLFPQFIATGAIGAQRGDLGTAAPLGQHVWSLGAGALWPLLDFGTLDAQVQAAKWQTRALLVAYKRAIQTAVQQVDTTVAALRAQQASLASLGEALLASERAVTLANERYNRGLTDFLNVVDAERAEYAIQDQFIAAQTSVAEQFIALYRYLGGGWQSYQKIPGIVKPLPAILAIFRDTLAKGDDALRQP